MNNKDFIEGVQIIGKYLEPAKYSLCAKPDEIWFGKVEGVSEKDKKRLEDIGWDDRSGDTGNYHCFT